MANSNTRHGVISTDETTVSKLQSLINPIANAQHQPKGTVSYIRLPKGITEAHFAQLRLRASDPIAQAIKACKERLDTFYSCQFVQNNHYWLWGLIKIKWAHQYIIVQTYPSSTTLNL